MAIHRREVRIDLDRLVPCRRPLQLRECLFACDAPGGRVPSHAAQVVHPSEEFRWLIEKANALFGIVDKQIAADVAGPMAAHFIDLPFDILDRTRNSFGFLVGRDAIGVRDPWPLALFAIVVAIDVEVSIAIRVANGLQPAVSGARAAIDEQSPTLAGFFVGLIEFAAQSPFIPWGYASLIPFAECWPCFVRRQIEIEHQHARRMKCCVLTTLAANGPRYRLEIFPGSFEDRRRGCSVRSKNYWRCWLWFVSF